MWTDKQLASLDIRFHQHLHNVLYLTKTFTFEIHSGPETVSGRDKGLEAWFLVFLIFKVKSCCKVRSNLRVGVKLR